jgi:NADH dehydrogenase
MDPSKPRVVIVGGGFAGIAAARALRRTEANVVIIDKHNHHLFQPLLYQVATAALHPGTIAAPIRSLVSGQKNCRVLMNEVDEVDLDASQGGHIQGGNQ